MRRLAVIVGVIVAAAASLAVRAPADDSRTYLIEMYNAFGIVEGSDVRVAGVNAGTVKSLDINSSKRAVIEVELSGPLAVLGEDTECESEPQSLIAEYFIDCVPDGPEIKTSGDPEDPDIPASQVTQTVQPDLVQNTLREPYKRRLQLLINEFGTALAGNADNLNEAIRLGAPALTSSRRSSTSWPTRTGSSGTSTSTRTRSSPGSRSAATTSSSSSRRPAIRRRPPRPSATRSPRTSRCSTTSWPSCARPSPSWRRSRGSRRRS